MRFAVLLNAYLAPCLLGLACLVVVNTPLQAEPTTKAVSEAAVPLPSGNEDEAELRKRLEQVRALNAKLRAERKELERQLGTLQEQVAVEGKRLTEREQQPQAKSQPPSSLDWRPYALAVFLVMGGVGYLLRRRRARAGSKVD